MSFSNLGMNHKEITLKALENVPRVSVNIAVSREWVNFQLWLNIPPFQSTLRSPNIASRQLLFQMEIEWIKGIF